MKICHKQQLQHLQVLCRCHTLAWAAWDVIDTDTAPQGWGSTATPHILQRRERSRF